MEGRLVDTQRAILFQFQKLSLTHAKTDVRLNTMSLKFNLVLERDETKKHEITMLLNALEKEEMRLKTELLKTNHEFLNVIQGPSVSQLLSGIPTASASLLLNSANNDKYECVKR